MDLAKIISYTATDSSGSFLLEHLDTGYMWLVLVLSDTTRYKKWLSLTDPLPSIEFRSLFYWMRIPIFANMVMGLNQRWLRKNTWGFIINTASTSQQAGRLLTYSKHAYGICWCWWGNYTKRQNTNDTSQWVEILISATPDQIPASSIESIEILTQSFGKIWSSCRKRYYQYYTEKNKQNGANGCFAVGTGVEVQRSWK